MITNKLIVEIKSKINDNQKQGITGGILQGVLLDMVESLSEAYPQNYTDEQKAQARANIDALSDHNGEITKEKLSAEVQAILDDVANKQNISDESLATIAKTIVGAINEVYNGGLKDASIATSKIEDGAITEPKLDTDLVNVITSAVQPAELAAAIATAVSSYVAKADIVDTTGSATDKVMSQHGVTEAINGVTNKVTELLSQEMKLPIIWNQGYLNNGIPVSNDSRHYTNLFPIIDGFSYEIYGPVQVISCYSAPYLDAESFLGNINSGANIIEGTKYIAFWCSDSEVEAIGGYENFGIASLKYLNDYLANTSFTVRKETFAFSRVNTISIRKTQIDMIKCAIKGFYFYGDSVDKDATYYALFQKTTSSLRVIIYNSSNTILIDKTINIPSNGIIDSEQINGGYGFHIIIDCNITENALATSSSLNFVLSKNAFSPFIGDVRQIEANKEDIASLQSQMNDADAIDVRIKETEEVDYLSYFESAKGGESGYISSVNGSIGSNSLMTRTAYLPLEGVLAIKTKTPSGSSAGLAFYSGNNQAQYATEFISGINSGNGGSGNSWISIPSGAKYFRTTVMNSDLTGETAIFMVRRYKKETLQEFVDGVLSETTKPEPRATHVFYGYEGFCDGIEGSDGEWIASQDKLTTSRNNLVLSTQNDNIRQIVSERQLYVNKMKYEVAFEVNDANSFFSIGTKGLSIINELRVRNDNGSALLEIYAGSGGADTYEPGSPKVVISKSMSFALVAGNVYKLGMRKFENETYNNVEHMDGVVYYIQSYSDNVIYEEFVPRDTTIHEGIRNGITASCKGVQFVSLKVGDVTVDNIFVSSEYDVRAKAIILGDSIVDGDTLIGTDTLTGCGQKNKYACLLQSAIGMNSFVIAGKGGDSMSQSSIPYLMKEVQLFVPGYCILAFGANHSTFDGFKTNMEIFCSWLVSIGVTPILETICPASGRSAELIAQMSNWVRNSGYRFVDLNKAVTVDGAGLVWKDGYVNSDGVHPTPLGHRAIYDAFVKELPELFSV